MEFFDKLGKKASEAYKMTADKTGKIAKETKMKFRIGELKSQINDLYEEIGKKVYESHVKKEEISIQNDLEEQCTKIDVLSDEIEGLLKQCLELKDKKQCPKCFKEIEKDAKFCPSCGAKQEETEVKEVEILEDVETTEVEDDDLIDNQINIEDVEKNNTNNNAENEESTETSPDSKDESSTCDNLEKTVQVESNVKDDDEDASN